MNQKLLEFIEQQRQKGIADEQIRQTLLEHKWDSTLVAQALHEASHNGLPSTNATPQPNLSNTTLNQGPVFRGTEEPLAGAAPTPLSPDLSPEAPQKYNVTTALSDAVGAIRQNVAVVLPVFLIGIGIIYGTSLLVELLIRTFITSDSMSIWSMPSLGALAAMAVIYLAFYLIASAYLVASTAQAIADGRKQERRSIGGVLQASWLRLPKLIGAQALFTLVLFWPFAAIMIGGILISLGASGASQASINQIIFPIAYILAFCWVVIGMLRFALVPYVAIFEPEVPVVRTLARSQKLLQDGGQWFLFKLIIGSILLYVGMFILMISALGTNAYGTGSFAEISIILSLASFVISLLFFGIFVMLYLNRRAVRG